MTSSSPSSGSKRGSFLLFSSYGAVTLTALLLSPLGSSASSLMGEELGGRGAGSLKGLGPGPHVHPPLPTDQNSAYLTSRPRDTLGQSSCGPNKESGYKICFWKGYREAGVVGLRGIHAVQRALVTCQIHR